MATSAALVIIMAVLQAALDRVADDRDAPVEALRRGGLVAPVVRGHARPQPDARRHGPNQVVAHHHVAHEVRLPPHDLQRHHDAGPCRARARNKTPEANAGGAHDAAGRLLDWRIQFGAKSTPGLP